MFKKKPSEAELEKRREILRARGVPEAFIENLATRRDPLLPYDLAALPVAFASTAASGAIMFWLFHVFDGVIAARAAALHLAQGAILYNYSDVQELSFVLLMIGLVSLPFWIWMVLRSRPAPYPKPSDVASSLRILGKEECDGIHLAKVGIAAASAKSEEDFIRLMNRGATSIVRTLTFIFLGLAVVGYGLGQDVWWRVTPEKIVTHRFGMDEIYAFTDVRFAEVGCNEVTDNGKSEEDIVFILHTKDRNIRIDEAAQTYADDPYVSRLQHVHDLLSAQRVPIRRWQWLELNPLASGCVADWARRLGPQGQVRIDRLMALS